VERNSMKKSYANSRVVPIWFDDSTVEKLNRMALHMKRPRNRIVRRMLELMLADIDAGRKLYPE
jgi:predicted transcriptional regulator